MNLSLLRTLLVIDGYGDGFSSGYITSDPDAKLNKLCQQGFLSWEEWDDDARLYTTTPKGKALIESVVAHAASFVTKEESVETHVMERLVAEVS
jgi:DNA-binding MarR family transcriptional regulator